MSWRYNYANKICSWNSWSLICSLLIFEEGWHHLDHGFLVLTLFAHDSHCLEVGLFMLRHIWNFDDSRSKSLFDVLCKQESKRSIVNKFLKPFQAKFVKAVVNPDDSLPTELLWVSGFQSLFRVNEGTHHEYNVLFLSSKSFKSTLELGVHKLT